MYIQIAANVCGYFFLLRTVIVFLEKNKIKASVLIEDLYLCKLG